MAILDVKELTYSEKYSDDKFDYRHIIIPREFSKHLPKTHLMTETEWRNLGIQQSPGWEHYMIHVPEPHILMFRKRREPEKTLCQQSNSVAIHAN